MQRVAKQVLSLVLIIQLTTPVSSAPYMALSQTLIQPTQLSAIYQHLVSRHWVPETGLFISFLGTGDRKLSQQASTYEQGAVGLLAIRLGDRARADGIARFFKEAWTGQGFPNFFNAEFGQAGIEKTVHVGPNAWAGLFLARYANTYHDPEFDQLACDIAHWMAPGIAHRHGGIAMGPRVGADGVPWPQVFSTENNLSYYAFLTELLRSSRLSPATIAELAQERDGVESWLTTEAFDRSAYTMNRGENPAGMDRIRALDTTTWLVSAVGPQKLMERGIDPDRLMRTAEKYFEVSVRNQLGVDPTNQPEADTTYQLPAKGPNGESARPMKDEHRQVWFEGLGQYINALGRMADYARRQGRNVDADRYAQKADQLGRQFDDASLAAYDHAAYAYATPGKFFHDGWWTPAEGKDGPASSLIGATWRCFAGLGWDPLSGQQIRSVHSPSIVLPDSLAARHPSPRVLYGASEEMTVHAWNALNQKNYALAVDQAKATIDEWGEWAGQLQAKKMKEVGSVLSYDGSAASAQKIFNYWALNDVAAAYFILGKSLDAQGRYTEAAKAFQHILLHESLAQVWDPKGWFWSPSEAVQQEYVYGDPKHYRDVMPELFAADASSYGKQPN